ncbi:hypothetical protein BDV18DRAFT_142286 [Aspergillus unguis]
MAIQEPLFSRYATKQVQQLDASSKCRILHAFWPHLQLSPSAFTEADYAGYFCFIGTALQGLSSAKDDFAAQDFERLCGIIRVLRVNPNWNQKGMIVNLRRSYLDTSDIAICRSIQLAVGLWLCLDVDSPGVRMKGHLRPQEGRVYWGFDELLDQMIAAHFPEPVSKPIVSIEYQIDKSFTLANLTSIRGLRVRWTDNLRDHLRLEGQKGQRILLIFQHRIFLLNHYTDPEPVLPKAVLREAILSLDLLLPCDEPATLRFLTQSKLTLGSPLQARGTYGLEQFTYYRENLVELLEILHGPPETLVQSLRDTRNLVDSVTIWVAVFGVFVLTLVFGFLTTVYSIKQYRVSVLSYELSLAVACQERTGPLPGFCD